MARTDKLRLERARGETIDQVVALLQANGLPHEDVRAKPDCFYLGFDETTWIATGGIEQYGSDGLIRSIAVKDSHQSQGYGTAMCDGLETQARADGIQRLYLLTTTAAPFFRKIGYRTIARETVPEAIRRTTEFTDYCPDSASCMWKDLRDADAK